MKPLSRVTAFVLSMAFVAITTGCVVGTKGTKIAPQMTSLYKGTYRVDPYMEDHKPRTVAVLPFIDKSGSTEGCREVRKGFYNHFSSLPFKDVELYRVDRLLAKAGLTDTAEIYKITPQELGKILEADAVVYGEISDFDKLFAGVYSQVSVGAEVRMYETKTGHFLWSGRHVARIHQGGIATTPVGIIATVIAAAMNMRDIQLLRACDDLFRDMVKTIPTPTIAEAMRPPVITLLTQDTKGLPKKAGDEIRVVIQGTPKMQASFDIGDYRKNIDMQEVEPGGYLGVYRVVPGDNVENVIITGHLTDDSGNRTDWVDAIGFVTLDTTPPQKPKGLTGIGRDKHNLLRWEKNADPDLTGYRLYRSQTPLTGYIEVVKTELTEAKDHDLVNFQKYYYRVSAVDRAGNESEKSEAVCVMPVAPGPTAVSGAIVADTTWYSGASPYVIEDTVTVVDKAVLTVEPGTEIRSKGKGIVVEGRITALGDRESLITFGGMDGTRWEGITFRNVKEKENVVRFARVRNALAGVTCESSSPRIEDSEFIDNAEAVKIGGAFSKPFLSRNTIQRNETGVTIVEGAQPYLVENLIRDNAKGGIVVSNAAPSIQRNTVILNQGSGVIVRNSQALVAENNIFDNAPFDMVGSSSGEPVKAHNNWWGTAQGFEVFKKVQGRVDLTKVLDGPYPAGKPLDLPVHSSSLGGPLTGDGYLVLSNSPYRVTKDVIVDGGHVLYIQSGVQVLYDQKTSIVVKDGGVVAKGTRERPILFSAAAASPVPGFYTHAIQFAAPTKVNSFLEYAIVKYADTAIDVQYGSPDISYSYIAENAQAGLFCGNDASPKITFNTFLGNQGQGAIACRGMSRPKINHNNFIGNVFAVQAFSSICIDARWNWWGNNPPDEGAILKDNEDSINLKPWLKEEEKRAFMVE
ncbi:MAG: DUF799 family lipoprotein [Syntrophobacterales bacterium]|nr:DUF799 family lipoprotein [Syntrophobacterales bacterium]